MDPVRPIAAFDFDGTITTSDSLRAFVAFAAGGARFLAGVLRTAPWLAGAATGRCDRGAAKARFLAATLGGRSRTGLEAAARRFAAERLPAMVRPEMLARILEHKRLGHALVLVSASPTLYLEPWAVQAGFDAVLGTELEFIDGRLTGRLATPNCWGPEKVRRLGQWLGSPRPRLDYGYGDSRGDREMLALAGQAWLRGRDARLPSI
jgi:phosphatidylglycerophosphatase C